MIAGDRRQPASLTMSEKTRAAWERALRARAEKLEALGTKILEAAEKKPIDTTPNNGRQVSAQLTAALRVLEAADRAWLRLGRGSIGPVKEAKGPKSKWRGLL